MSGFKSIEFKNDKIVVLDQRKVPLEEIYHTLSSIEEGHWSIKEMIVRGAPLIGFTGIFSMALFIKKNPKKSDWKKISEGGSS